MPTRRTTAIRVRLVVVGGLALCVALTALSWDRLRELSAPIRQKLVDAQTRYLAQDREQYLRVRPAVLACVDEWDAALPGAVALINTGVAHGELSTEDTAKVREYLSYYQAQARQVPVGRFEVSSRKDQYTVLSSLLRDANSQMAKSMESLGKLLTSRAQPDAINSKHEAAEAYTLYRRARKTIGDLDQAVSYPHPYSASELETSTGQGHVNGMEFGTAGGFSVDGSYTLPGYGCWHPDCTPLPPGLSPFVPRY